MRKTIYQMNDHSEIEQLLADATHGFLATTTPDGWPAAVPVNFVYRNRRIYFHGAPSGEKMASLAVDARVSFTVVEDFSIVPSYFRDPALACPATQYYRSVMLRGRARVVDDVEEKALALQSLMEKLQPEGGHEPITADSPLYRKSLATTAVCAIEIESLAAKFKFGQNLPRDKREAVAAGLTGRGCPIDHATVERMRAYNR